MEIILLVRFHDLTVMGTVFPVYECLKCGFMIVKDMPDDRLKEITFLNKEITFLIM
jgi:hypothetical protein